MAKKTAVAAEAKASPSEKKGSEKRSQLPPTLSSSSGTRAVITKPSNVSRSLVLPFEVYRPKVLVLRLRPGEFVGKSLHRFTALGSLVDLTDR